MPFYRVLQPSFVGGRMREEGVVVQYDGAPSANLLEVSQSEFAAQQGRLEPGSGNRPYAYHQKP